MIVTSSKVLEQGALVIVQRNTLAPTPKAVTPLVGELIEVIVPAPLCRVQVPVPGVAVLPAKVAVVVQTD